MSISIPVKAVSLGALLALLVPLSTAQAQTRGEDPGTTDVARTPLEDFNIDSDDIPEILVAAVGNPYNRSGLDDCNAIVAQIAVLDNELGPDFDIPQEEGSRLSAGRVAKSVVGSFIPFRGIVREVSGANKKRDSVRLAVTAGMVRRGYLKGIGEARGCGYPAAPRTEKNTNVTGVPDNLPRDP